MTMRIGNLLHREQIHVNRRELVVFFSSEIEIPWRQFIQRYWEQCSLWVGGT